MTDSPFQALVREREGPKLVKNSAPDDDPASPDGYQAVRRIRSFQFADVVFRTHRGAVQAFPWSHLRTWAHDDTGRRMTLIWPEVVVVLTGRGLDNLHEDLMRRIIAELRQVAPGQADAVPPGLPVIESMDITPLDGEGGAGQ